MKNKFYYFLLTALMGLFGMNASAQTTYEIGTAQDLMDFAAAVNGGEYNANAVLTADIDCSSITNWTPIGSATDKDDGKYKGTFDGQGHTISNLVISRTIGCTGIFNTTAGVTLKNFIVDSSCTITDTGANLAGVVGRHQASGTSATATSTFSGIGNAGDVTISGSNKENPGGLIGGCWGKKDVNIIIENCWTSGTVLSSGGKSGNCGAFIGWMNGGKLTVNNCWTIATVETAAADKYLVRAANNTNTAVTFNNCYSLNGTQVPNLEAADVASGAFCFKLNEALTADVWFQNLDNGDDVDEVPVPFSTHGTVYKNATYLCPNTIGDDVSYSNTFSSVIPEHDYAVDGFCTFCGYLVQDSEGCFEISNAEQLAWFATHVNNTNQTANAKLTADIDMTDIAATWIPIGDWHTGKVTSAFSGHFDGQGHRITGFNFTTSQNYYGIFGVVSAATIENFSISGTITNDSYSNFGVIGYSRDATTNIRNIQSYLTITNNANDKNAGGILGSGNAGTTNIDRCAFFGEIIANQKTNAGGIIGYFKNGNDAIVNITNCLFAGTITSEIENSYCGGMAGYGGANVNSVKIQNCLSLGTLDAPVNGQFFGNIRNAGSTVANCYYQGDNTIGSGSSDLTNLEATAVTDEQLASGEVCYLLNGDQTAITWYQTIDTDANPTLDATSAQVYVNGTVCPDTGAPQGTVSYSNTPGTTVGSHVPVDGFCTYCGTFDPNYMTPVNDVFEIGTPTQLKWFAVYANQVEPASNALLTADIDLTGVTMPSIGNSSVAYAGEFDGQGFAISNFEGISEGYGGFFGKTNGATIKNFSIDGILTVTTGTGSGVIGWPENSTISNIHSALVVDVPNSGTHHVGGVVGSARGSNTIDRCTFSGSMTVAAGSTDNFAGVVAYVTHDNTVQKHDEVTNCANYGDITFYDAGCAAGGVLGYLNSTAVVLKNCLNVGEIIFAGEGSPKYGGAILGRTKNTNFTKITNNFWLEGSAYGASKNDSGVDALATESSTAEQFSSGEVTAKLGIAFRQNIGSDEAPVLDPTHNVIAQITEAGYATLYVPDTDLTIPTGVTAWTGEYEETWLKLNAVSDKIAADEPVVLMGTAGIYSFEPTTGAEKDATNVLKGAAKDTEAAGKYVLAKPGENAVGFYKADKGTIKAGKAYLEVDSSVKAFLFAGDDATGIENLNNQNTLNTQIYNLAGQRMSKMHKGINIVDGKKILK